MDLGPKETSWTEKEWYGDGKTTTKKNEPNPIFNETLNMRNPMLNEIEVHFKLMDDDTLSKDDMIGEAKYVIKRVDILADSKAEADSLTVNINFKGADDDGNKSTLTFRIHLNSAVQCDNVWFGGK